MGSQPDRQISDPLLRPDGVQRDARGAPVRAPLGNSIRTLLAFALLLLIGVAVWWIRRPDDLSMQLGGREWVITDVDGEPATNRIGTVSTFVLDGTGEIRATLDCNVASGDWRYETQSGRLKIDWETQTMLPCPEDWPETYLPDGGEVSVDGGVLRIESDAVVVRAVSLADRDPAAVDEVAGEWVSGARSVEIGRRGLFQIDACRGSWSLTEDESAMDVAFDELQPDACSLDPEWRDDTLIVPVADQDSVYLWRDRSIYPLDRAIVRLDPVE